MSRSTPYVIEGEHFDPLKSPHAFYDPFHKGRKTHTKWGRFMRWLRATFQGRL